MGSSLLSIIPIKDGLSNRNSSYSGVYSSLQQERASYSWADLLLSNSLIRKSLIDSNPFYCWTCSSFQQQRALATNYLSLVALLPNSSTLKGFISKPIIQQSNKKGSNRQQPFLLLDMFISLVAKGLSNKLPFFGYTITQQFNIRGLYQQTLIQLGRSIIIQQSNKKGFNRKQPFLPLDMFISPAAKGLSNRLPFFGCTITQQFNIRGLYQQTLIQLGRSIIIQQSNKKGFNRQRPFLPLDIFISPATKGLNNRLPFFGYTIT